MRRIPGFRSGTRWKQIVAVLGYLTMLSFLLVGLGGEVASLVMGLFGLLMVVLVANLGGLRSKIPLLKSSNRLVAAGGWAVLGLAGFVAFAAAVPLSTDPVVQPTPTAAAITVAQPTPIQARQPTVEVSRPAATLASQPIITQPVPSPALTATVVPAAALPAPSPTPTVVSSPRPTSTLTPTTNTVEVHIIDVGQGDAILVRSPEGQVALIDGGDTNSRALPYLRSQGVERLDWVIATHPHSDHIGGLVEVLEAVPVAKVVTNGQEHTTAPYVRFLEAIEAARAEYVEVSRGDTLSLGSLTLQVLNPTKTTGDMNNNSVVVRLVHGQTTFLFTGDAEREAEESMLLSSVFPVKADVLKVGHHGSRTSSNPQFLSLVKPQIAIYSAGAGNTYGHPHAETLAALAGVGAKVYGTDAHGTVVVTSDGSGYSVRTSKEGTPRAPPAIATATRAGSTAIPATATATPQPILVPSPFPQPSSLTLDIISVTSPVSRGSNATLAAKTAAGAACTITIHYASGPSSAAGLEPKAADGAGNVSWTWSVGPRTTAGEWRIVVTSSKDGQKVTKETKFVVQ